MNALRIPSEVAQSLGFYVYALRDPRDGQVFYIGKGMGDRVYSHERDAADSQETESEKLSRISDIRKADGQVEHLFLRVRIEDEATAFVIEQAVIDSYAATGTPLTNLAKGHGASTYGLSTVEAAVALVRADPTPPIEEPVIAVVINGSWTRDASPTEIYDAARGYWNINFEVRSKARYALAVAFGIVRAAYAIDREGWYPSSLQGEEGKLWGFAGEPSQELAHVIGTKMRINEKPGDRSVYRRFLKGYPGEPAAKDIL